MSKKSEPLPYRYALNVTSQFYFCCIPFRFDTTPKCSMNCRYCFAMARGGRRTSLQLIADTKSITRKITRALDKYNTSGDVSTELLNHRVPIHFGGISDPFPSQKINEKSLDILKIFSQYDYPVVLSTKNTDELIRPHVLNLIKNTKHLVIQISFSTADDSLSALIEPGAPKPSSRLQCMKCLSDNGINIVARVQPLIFPWIAEVRNILIPKLAESGCRHVILEFLKVPVERNVSMFKNFTKAISWDAYDFYKSHGALLIGREWLLPNILKWELLQDLITAIRRCGMTYGSGDYGLNHLGDTACCCGLDLFKGFSGWFKGNFSNIIRNSTEKLLYFDMVRKYWYPKKSIRRILNSKCRLPEQKTILDYLRSKWNSPGTVNAPDSYLGVSWTGERDKKGNCTYHKAGTL